MREDVFLQRKDFFVLDALRCLRHDNSQNQCSKCINICDFDAIVVFKKKITLKSELCTNCGECIGSCPTESLSLESFDITNFVLEFVQKDTNTVTDGLDIPTLAMLDVHHIVSMIIRKKSNLEFIATSQTKEKIIKYISDKIDTANLFLEQIKSGYKAQLVVQSTSSDIKKRGLLKNIFSITKDIKQDINASTHLKKAQKFVPPKVTLFKNSLKLIADELEVDTINTVKGLIANKKIDFQTCTNCGECAHFCPTQALFRTSDNDGIYFQSGKCIGCGVCKMVCEPNAITSPSTVELNRFMFDQADLLVQYEYRPCVECKTAFAYKGTSDLCDRCGTYKNDFEDMFTMAKDI
ncbi:4Fe-4S binding protein [Arcobacter sp. FWKO B]|uniref:4Fe-4S binding protein n=1 Tax=Arcobacter sp. FWKO B TaxID=2593672 RepID=UPI0018A630C6|nr:4Fe-4S binding protein [Arcobacter sp. FWKO B]QOG11728.1 4Fe-4S dicluster domain-containing protein [Arcobacter sp. FWKO B]